MPLSKNDFEQVIFKFNYAKNVLQEATEYGMAGDSSPDSFWRKNPRFIADEDKRLNKINELIEDAKKHLEEFYPPFEGRLAGSNLNSKQWQQLATEQIAISTFLKGLKKFEERNSWARRAQVSLVNAESLINQNQYYDVKDVFELCDRLALALKDSENLDHLEESKKLLFNGLTQWISLFEKMKQLGGPVDEYRKGTEKSYREQSLKLGELLGRFNSREQDQPPSESDQVTKLQKELEAEKQLRRALEKRLNALEATVSELSKKVNLGVSTVAPALPPQSTRYTP